MREITAFNKSEYFADFVGVNRSRCAINESICAAIGTIFIRYFIKCKSVLAVGCVLKKNKFAIINFQKEMFCCNLFGIDVCDYIIERLGMTWVDEPYSSPNGNLVRGKSALCSIRLNGGRSHTISVIFHRELHYIYIFDPNHGVYEFSPVPWYNGGFRSFMEKFYPSAIDVTFRNCEVMLNHKASFEGIQ